MIWLSILAGGEKAFAYKVKCSSQPERMSSVIITPTAVQTWSWLKKRGFLIRHIDIVDLG